MSGRWRSHLDWRRRRTWRRQFVVQCLCGRCSPAVTQYHVTCRHVDYTKSHVQHSPPHLTSTRSMQNRKTIPSQHKQLNLFLFRKEKLFFHIVLGSFIIADSCLINNVSNRRDNYTPYQKLVNILMWFFPKKYPGQFLTCRNFFNLLHLKSLEQ